MPIAPRPIAAALRQARASEEERGEAAGVSMAVGVVAEEEEVRGGPTARQGRPWVMERGGREVEELEEEGHQMERAFSKSWPAR